MQKQFVLAIAVTVLEGAVCAPHCEAGPIRRVIMMKNMQKKQQQKQQQQQSGTGSTTAGTKSPAMGAAGTTSTAK